MLTVMIKGVKMRCKSFMTKFLTAVGLLIETSKSTEKTKGSIEVSPSTMKPPGTVTYNSPVIYSSLLSSFFFRIIFRTNGKICQGRDQQ